MEVSAKLLRVRLSAQKCRLVADQVRGLSVERALDLLEFSPKKAARFVRQALASAVANAENNFGIDVDELNVSTIYVDKATVLKRMRPRAKGRGCPILKPTCHITVKVSDDATLEKE